MSVVVSVGPNENEIEGEGRFTHEEATGFSEKAGVLYVENDDQDIIAIYAREAWRSAQVVIEPGKSALPAAYEWGTAADTRKLIVAALAGDKEAIADIFDALEVLDSVEQPVTPSPSVDAEVAE